MPLQQVRQSIPVPQTLSEFDALSRQRNELSGQLSTLTSRRNELQEQRQHMSAEAGRGHDTRIAAIDAQSAAIERQLFQVNAAIAGASGTNFSEPRTSITVVPPDASLVDRMRIRSAVENAVQETMMGVGAGFLALYVAWRGFRRFIWKAKPTPILDQTARIDQLQRSMDVVAIEVERISEAQRYLAKVLNDKLEIGAGEARR